MHRTLLHTRGSDAVEKAQLRFDFGQAVGVIALLVAGVFQGPDGLSFQIGQLVSGQFLKTRHSQMD